MAIAKLKVTAFDCPDPMVLAGFYASMTGWEPVQLDADWVQLRNEGGPTLAFQLAPDYQAPTWPGGDHPLQAHLDFEVDDLDAGEAAVLAIGARRAEHQAHPTEFRVYLDPVGYPFCLVLSDDLRP